MARLIIGAPSLGKDGANKRARELFESVAFPLSVEIINKMTITLSMPEAGGTFGPLATRVATFKNFDRLQRAVSSFEQVAKLNTARALVEMVTQDDEAAPEDEQPDSGSGSGDDNPVIKVVKDDGAAYVVEFQGVSFEPLRNQVREDGTLTAGGLKALKEAQAAAKTDEKEG